MKRILGIIIAVLVAGLVIFQGRCQEESKVPQWIWYPEKDMDPIVEAPAEPRYFVKIINLESPVKSAVLEIAVDNIYQLFVNGKAIGEGDNWQIATKYDITKNLKKGKNVIAIQATNVDGPAGWIMKGKITTADGKTIVFFSNSSWRTSTRATKGWQEGELDKSWVKALEMGEFGVQPWGTNVQCEMLAE